MAAAADATAWGDVDCWAVAVRDWDRSMHRDPKGDTPTCPHAARDMQRVRECNVVGALGDLGLAIWMAVAAGDDS